MKNLTPGPRASPRPESGLVQVRAQGMRKQTHAKSTLIRQGSLRSNMWLCLHQAHKSPSEHVKATLIFGGSIIIPQLQTQELPFSLWPASGHGEWGPGWTDDHMAGETSPGHLDGSRAKRVFPAEWRSSERLQLRPFHAGKVGL